LFVTQIFWTLLIAGGTFTSIIVIFYRESNPTILIRQKTRRLAKELKRTDLRSCYDTTLQLDGSGGRHYQHQQRSRTSTLLRGLTRPTKMLLMSPIVGLLALYVAIIYGCLYLLFNTTSTVFRTEYHWRADLAGLAYIGLGLGLLSGQMVFGLSSDRIIVRLTQANNGVYQPEMRLTLCLMFACFVPVSFFWYGWSIHAHTHWIVPIIGLYPFGFGMIGIFISIQTYIVDAYSQYAASGIAAMTVARSFAGAFLPLAGSAMYKTLGYGVRWYICLCLAIHANLLISILVGQLAARVHHFCSDTCTGSPAEIWWVHKREVCCKLGLVKRPGLRRPGLGDKNS
jgi:hypothetical protein